MLHFAYPYLLLQAKYKGKEFENSSTLMKELGSLTWTDYQLQKEQEFCVKDHYIMGSRVESDQGSVTLYTLMGNKVRVLLAFVCATRDFFHACCFKTSRHVLYGCLFKTRCFIHNNFFINSRQPSETMSLKLIFKINFAYKFSFCNPKVILFFTGLILHILLLRFITRFMIHNL
jgi:hypothetical protein